MKYIIKSICGTLFITMFFICNSYAFDCYITMIKASCWKNYDLHVIISDAEKGDKLGEITVFEGKLWSREKFSCTQGQTLALEAKFSPEIWSGDVNKVYKATRFWRLPKEAKNAGALGWNIAVCYPEWFADVPTPPNATANCACDLNAVPEFKI